MKTDKGVPWRQLQPRIVVIDYEFVGHNRGINERYRGNREFEHRTRLEGRQIMTPESPKRT